MSRCLTAIEGGSRRPDALLVIDQAPSEAARRRVEASSLPAARYVEQGLCGLAASRNLGLELAGSDVVAFTDDDVVPEPTWVEGIMAPLRRDPVPDVVTGPVLALGPDAPGLYAVSERLRLTPSYHTGRVIPWHAGSGGNFSARRALLIENGGWDERLGVGSPGLAGEDIELLYRLMRAGALVRYEPAALVRHERQSWERRLATRYSYSFGIGALCGLWVRRGDRFALRMALSYAWIHGRGVARGFKHLDPRIVHEHLRGLWGVAPGLLYGLRAKRRDQGH